MLWQTGDNDGRTFSSSICSSSSHPLHRFSSLSVYLRFIAYVCARTCMRLRVPVQHIGSIQGGKTFVSPFRDVINCIIIPRCVRPQPKQMLIGHKSRPLRFVRATTSQEGSEPVCFPIVSRPKSIRDSTWPRDEASGDETENTHTHTHIQKRKKTREN